MTGHMRLDFITFRHAPRHADAPRPPIGTPYAGGRSGLVPRCLSRVQACWPNWLVLCGPMGRGVGKMTPSAQPA